MQQRFLVNGLHYAATVTPPSHDRHAETLLLLHGFTGSSASWDDSVTPLATNRRVVALDLPGHGNSDSPSDPARYSMEHMVADIAALQQCLKLTVATTIILGYSLGGRIALAAAAAGLCRAVVLESASPGLADATERQQRRTSDEALAQRMSTEGMAAFVAYWEQLPLFAGLHQLAPVVQQRLHLQRLRNDPIGLGNSLRGIGTGVQPSYWHQLATLTIPVVLIAGANDHKFVAIAQQMAQSLPQSQLQIVSGAGHTVHAEQPAQFIAIVQQFCHALHSTDRTR